MITAKDHASIQLNIADVDAEGRSTNSFVTYALSGFIRKEAEGDDAINRLSQQDGCKLNKKKILEKNLLTFYLDLKNVFSYQQ